MKAVIATVVLVLAIFSTGAAGAVDLKIHLTGVQSSAGDIRLVLFDNEGSFLKKGNGLVIPAAEGGMDVVYRDLPSGTYALAVHHDENDSGEMDKSIFGVPVEGYGFSNNARSLFGPPAFSEAAFVVGDITTRIEVALEY